ncbi:glycosyltransferase family 2 protein [Bacillus sp. USDA818B3_A]|uniref:glycosyltransferase family 2 protein n=1 Tax=Bacillus sp. USDA818B3_A TaxID=2698834 RepID=UPI00136B8ECA|nr:glycosyltransferase [Bacillus sp. USDA818B3_A]
MKPIISVIVPVYNVESYIKSCVDSILAQSFLEFELLLVDDGSNDTSGEICDEYARKDRRVRVVHKEYGGVSSARNLGVTLAQGDYISFVDSDDRIDEEMLQVLYDLCMQTDSDIGICKLGREINGRIINSDQSEFEKELTHNEAMKELFKGNLYRFSLCNKLFKKHCFKGVSFPEGRIHEDLSTTYRLFANSSKAVFTNFIGYIYIKRENSILTASYNQKRLDAFVGWEEILSFMQEKYSSIYNEVICCYVYWTIDNVFYILNQVHDSKERDYYLIRIQKNIRKRYKYIVKVESFSLLYKYYIFLLMANFRFFILSNQIKTLIGKRNN